MPLFHSLPGQLAGVVASLSFFVGQLAGLSCCQLAADWDFVHVFIVGIVFLVLHYSSMGSANYVNLDTFSSIYRDSVPTRSLT